mmetsp:Transcript_48176/g.114788  ORF Transcript_48176/g.114788 Transcript_48176/m.114788 type:complete len:334 (+) Transcript_48176:449-1450(+)
MEWAMKLRRPSAEPGHQSQMKLATSCANRMPISSKSPSVLSSLDCEQRKMASGYSRAMLFFMRRMSKEFPWKPWHSTKRCTPRYCFGAEGTRGSHKLGCGAEAVRSAPRPPQRWSKSTGRCSMGGRRLVSSMEANSGTRGFTVRRKFSDAALCASPMALFSGSAKFGLIFSRTMDTDHWSMIRSSHWVRSIEAISRYPKESMFSSCCHSSRIWQDTEFRSYARSLATASGVKLAPVLWILSRMASWRIFSPEHSKPAAGFREPMPIPAVDPLALTPLGFGSCGTDMPVGKVRTSTSQVSSASRCSGVRQRSLMSLNQACCCTKEALKAPMWRR